MTEGEWLACVDPVAMWEHLRGPVERRLVELYGRLIPMEFTEDVRLSERKSRLLAGAICRRVWDLVSEEKCLLLVDRWVEFPFDRDPASCRRAIDLAERAADQAVSAEEMESQSAHCGSLDLVADDHVASHTGDWMDDDSWIMAIGKAARAVHHASSRYPVKPNQFGGPTYGAFRELPAVFLSVGQAVSWRNLDRSQEPDPTEYAALCDLVRDIAGNPFRPITLAPHLRTPTAVSVAQAAYDGRDPASGHIDPVRLAVLADALEEAGCAEGDVLSHLRSPGPHVRGCWALDLVLGRE